MTSSVSLPALPPQRLRPPWALHDDTEPLEPTKRGRMRPEDVIEAPITIERRISTRERTWRDKMSAFDEGRGPDPIAIHCLRKHGRRFKPGGLASQTGMENLGGFSTIAISNVRLCTLNNSKVPLVRAIPPIY